MAGEDIGDDQVFVEIWGAGYRKHPDFRGWLEKVRREPGRTLASHKNDLRDRLYDGIPRPQGRGW